MLFGRKADLKRNVLGVFLDKAEVSDDVSWPTILTIYKLKRCPRVLFSVVSSYFSQRAVVIHHAGYLVERDNVSVNILFNDFLRFC